MTDTRKTDRQKRLRDALRENLKRRKAQAKGRAVVEAPRGDATDAADVLDISGKSDAKRQR